MKDFLTGSFAGSGVMTDWRGVVIDIYRIELNVLWHGGIADIEENWLLSGGQNYRHVQRLDVTKNDMFTITGLDVVGRGRGYFDKSGMISRYRQRVSLKGAAWTFFMRRSCYRTAEDTFIVRLKMRKWGVTLSECVYVLQKQHSVDRQRMHEEGTSL